MSDPPAKKRPWFQLHLSTCVVMMVVAGAFLGANIIKRQALSPLEGFDAEFRMDELENGEKVLAKVVRVDRRRYEYTGWPATIYEKGQRASYEVSRRLEEPGEGVLYTPEMIAEEESDHFPEERAVAYGPLWIWGGMLKNLAALLLFFTITALVFEFFEALRTYIRKQIAS